MIDWDETPYLEPDCIELLQWIKDGSESFRTPEVDCTTWRLIRLGLVAYQNNVGQWLTEKGEKLLAEQGKEHDA